MKAILTRQRSELAKMLRRQGIENFKNKEWVARTDNISNTITTFEKDNYLIEQ